MANESIRNLQNESTLFHFFPERMKNHLPNFVLSLKLKHIKLGLHYFISNSLYLMLIPFLCIVVTHLSTLTADDFSQLWSDLIIRFNSVTLVLSSVSIVLISTIYQMSRPRKVYLVNFACYKPDPSQMCSGVRYLQSMEQSGLFAKEILTFIKKILERSGIGGKSYVPKVLSYNLKKKVSIGEARKEKEGALVRLIEELLAKTGVKPRDIGILVVNGSGFNPIPSLSAMIVNRIKLRSNILSFNLGGMGCSAGPIAVDLAKKLLQVQSHSYALVVSVEIEAVSFYTGNDRSMVLGNCLFREGDAAILLSNRSSDRSRSKYELIRTLRTHMGADDKSYNCIMQQEDEFQNVGIKLTKGLIVVAGQVLKTPITTLGPLVLPMSEQLLFLATSVARTIFKIKIKPYVPDFKLAFEHFCVHVGGKAVLDEVEKNLQLSEWHMEPSRMTLYRFGNTSRSSLWYELAYSEAKGRIRKGDRIWQIGFGSGFKCNSAVWRALKTIKPEQEKNPWTDEIDDFPVQVPNIAPINFSFS